MPSRAEMQDLVDAHARLDEPMSTAIWIKTSEREAWLVEVIPALRNDKHPERPVMFNPGLTFRYPLNLIAGNLDDIRTALHQNRELASAVACGDVLHGPQVGEELKRLAKGVVDGAV